LLSATNYSTYVFVTTTYLQTVAPTPFSTRRLKILVMYVASIVFSRQMLRLYHRFPSSFRIILPFDSNNYNPAVRRAAACRLHDSLCCRNAWHSYLCADPTLEGISKTFPPSRVAQGNKLHLCTEGSRDG
jgi:hypothetical protein